MALPSNSIVAYFYILKYILLHWNQKDRIPMQIDRIVTAALLLASVF